MVDVVRKSDICFVFTARIVVAIYLVSPLPLLRSRSVELYRVKSNVDEPIGNI